MCTRVCIHVKIRIYVHGRSMLHKSKKILHLCVSKVTHMGCISDIAHIKAKKNLKKGTEPSTNNHLTGSKSYQRGNELPPLGALASGYIVTQVGL